jgi:LacI family transcriptional regulator
MAKMTLQFLADELHVSKSLVSRVLNNHKVGVSDTTRERIINAAKEYNYMPNRLAASLTLKKSKIIGYIIPNVYFDYFSQLSYWIERSAREQGYNVLMCNVNEDSTLEREYLRLYQTGTVDGLLVIPCDDHSNFDIYQAMGRIGFPFVFVDRYIKGINASLVSTNHLEAFNFLTKRLIEKGHRRILYIGHSLSTASSVQTERYRGYAKAMNDAGLDEQSLSIMSDINIEDHLLASIMSLPEGKRPTALVMISSQDIRPILKICRYNGFTIPHDIEIATIDKLKIPFTTQEDLELSYVIKEPIIVIEQQPEIIAKEAVALLLDRIKDEGRDVVTRLFHSLYKGQQIGEDQ